LEISYIHSIVIRTNCWLVSGFYLEIVFILYWYILNF